MNKDKFFVYCNESGFEVFETLDDALHAADGRIQDYLDDYTDRWSDEVLSVCSGKVTHRAKMCDQIFPNGEIDEDGLDEAGDYWEADCEYKCNYRIVGHPQPVPEVEKLVDALEAILEMQERNYGDATDTHVALAYLAKQAKEALAAYRQKGGEL